MTPGAAGGWDVSVRGRDDATPTTRHYEAVLVANGHHWDARLPEPAFPGGDTFTGTQTHSHHYKNFDGYEDKRVLVLGIGNSACDIAVETSKVPSGRSWPCGAARTCCRSTSSASRPTT